MFSSLTRHITPFLLTATLVSSNAIPSQNSARAALAVQDDLNTINADTQALSAALEAWSGGILFAFGIQSAANQLTADLQTATDNAPSNPITSDDESQAAINFIYYTMYASVYQCSQDLIAKKSLFDADGLTPTVQATVNDLADKTNAYGQALQQANPHFAAAGGSDVLALILGAVQMAQHAFAS